MQSCDSCALNFEEEQVNDNHVKTCVEKNYSNPEELENHENHENSKTSDVKITVFVPLSSCEHCLKTFKSVAELVVHSQICDMRSNRYTTVLPKCVSCRQECQSLEELNKHISECPRRNHSFVCPDCGDSFWTNHEFQAHFEFYCRKERRERLQ